MKTCDWLRYGCRIQCFWSYWGLKVRVSAASMLTILFFFFFLSVSRESSRVITGYGFSVDISCGAIKLKSDFYFSDCLT